MGPKKEIAAPISVKRDALKGKSVIITGEIEGRSRKAAEQILIDAGAKIEKSLNKKVELVILGENAGPSKLEKIEQLGCETKAWDDLIAEIKSEGDGGPTGSDDGNEEANEEEEEVEKPQKRKAEANTTAKAKPAPKAKPNPAPKAKPNVSAASSSISGKTVIITGTIPGHDRKSAQAIIEKAGAQVAKSLNKQVELVILGTDGGPDKLKKVEALGIKTIEWTDLAEELGIEAEQKVVAHIETGEAPDSIEGLTVIISGIIEGQTRSAAQKLLESAGAKYAKSLNKSVELVILGSNPGPDKLSKIAELGIDTCSFEALVESLDLKVKEPPKKKAKKN